MKYLRLFENFNDIDSICKKYEITNYTINDDGSIDVEGSVDLSSIQLISLEHCPKSVGGGFYCSNNKLSSLEGCPKSVGGDFFCYNNKITSFEGLPYSIGGELHCHNNPIYEIWRLFGDYSKIELFNDYDIIRGKDIVLYRLNSFLDEIGKDPVEKVKVYNTI